MRPVWPTAVHLFILILFIVACQPTPAATPVVTTTPIPATPSATATATAVATHIPPPATPIPPTPTATPFAPPDLQYLAAAIEQRLAEFHADGRSVSSYVIVDLATGDRFSHNPDVAIAGMSLVKIPVLIETYRALDAPPGIETTKLITQTTALSSNFAANLLLRTVIANAGAANADSVGADTYAGADILTESMRRLGAYNTFISVPIDMEPRPGQMNTYLTPANQRTDITTLADPFRQTTIGDLTLLLEMLYECAETGNGRLRTTYPDTITQAECQEIMTMLQLNELVLLLEAGLPPNTTFSHKIGYIDDTYGDLGIVRSPAGDYLIALALYSPQWLEWAIASPLFRDISQLTYDHFNNPAAYDPAVLAQPPALANTPTPAPTPAYPQAIVFGTSGIGLTLRSAPGGSEVAILPEGSVVSLLDTAVTEQNGLRWQQIQTSSGQTGWVGADFLVTAP
jgi:beta-lactamase class A